MDVIIYPLPSSGVAGDCSDSNGGERGGSC